MIIETRKETNANFKIKVKRSSAGLGLFAEEDIPTNKRIIEYVGIVQSTIEGKENKYIFNVSSKVDIDGAPRWNTARYINHSCEPNAESEIKKGHVYISSTRDIKKGEEITYNYGEEYFEKIIKPNGCKCSKCNNK